MKLVVDDGLDVLQEVRQVLFGRLATTAAKGVLAGDARAAFMECLADGIPSPAEELLSLTLSQAQGGDGVGNIPTSACADRQVSSSANDQITHFRGKIHTKTSCHWQKAL